MQQLLEFLSSFLHSLGISRVNNVNEGISIGEVISPILTKSLLPSNIPNVKLELIMGEVLNIEALSGGDGRYILNYIWTTSLERDFRMVVLPALSSPRTKIRSYYFLFFRRLRRMPINPPACVDIFKFTIESV
jgi:hypothetical protein